MRYATGALVVTGLGLAFWGLTALQTTAQGGCPAGEVSVQGQCTANLQDWIDYECGDALHSRSLAPPCVLPPATYELSDDDADGVCLRIATARSLIGLGARLVVPRGTVGIDIESTAAFTMLDGLTVDGTKRHDSEATVGIRVRAGRVKLRDVRVSDTRTGIEVLGIGADNANAIFVQNVHVWRSQIGIYLDGADANAGVFQHVDLNANYRGIVDSSFLGNTWIGATIHPYASLPEGSACDVECDEQNPCGAWATCVNEVCVCDESFVCRGGGPTCQPAAIWSDNANAANVFEGTYLEGNERGFQLSSSQAVVVGGNGVREAEGPASRLGSARSRAVFSFGENAGPDRSEVRLGSSSNIPIRIDSTDAQGVDETLMLRRFGGAGSPWCLTPGTASRCSQVYPGD